MYCNCTVRSIESFADDLFVSPGRVSSRAALSLSLGACAYVINCRNDSFGEPYLRVPWRRRTRASGPIDLAGTWGIVCVLDGRHIGPFASRNRRPDRSPVARESSLHCAACVESQRKRKIVEAYATYIATARWKRPTSGRSWTSTGVFVSPGVFACADCLRVVSGVITECFPLRTATWGAQ